MFATWNTAISHAHSAKLLRVPNVYAQPRQGAAESVGGSALLAALGYLWRPLPNAFEHRFRRRVP